ncbi:MAG: sensor histidine kinase [Gaiellaceae bacterium]
MRVTDSPQPEPIDIAWAVFAIANTVAMLLWPHWETIPFHFIWVSLTLLYGFRVWPLRPTAAVLGLVVIVTGILIFDDARQGSQGWGELFEVPLMSAMFLAMVWHGRRRQRAMDELAALAARQERFLHDASHELRTPITIARGHLDVLRAERGDAHELAIAQDELRRMESIVERLLLLAKADQPNFVVLGKLEVEPFLEDVFLRWSEIGPRRIWRLGSVSAGTLEADADAVRLVLDALIENAVEHTPPDGTIEINARPDAGFAVIEVRDDGHGIPAHALERIFERFGRADPARTRTAGGVGLGLSIVDAIVKAHGGNCTVRSDEQGTVFSLYMPLRRTLASSTRELVRTSR